ncbi:MAG: CPBP family intramembrane glutamic endopeptidase [Candidatus Caldarchaeum sp.]
MEHEINPSREIRDILLTIALAMATLYAGDSAAAFIGLSSIWAPQLALLAVALVLSRTEMLVPNLRKHRGILTGLALAPVATFSAIIASLLWSNIFPQTPATRQLAEALTPSTTAEYLLYIGLTFLVVAPAEEIIFRGIVHGKFSRLMRRGLADVVSSAIFAAVHMDLSRLGPTFVLGLFLAYSVDRTRSLTPAILIHAINNTAYITLLFLSSSTLAAENLVLP